MSEQLLRHSILITLVALFIAVNAAWAACPDKEVRPNSPCQTTANVCTPTTVFDSLLNCNVVVACNGTSENVSAGNFQCDLVAIGKFCHGSGNFAPCKTTCNCAVSSNPNPCLRTCVGVNCQATTAETQTTANCPPEG